MGKKSSTVHAYPSSRKTSPRLTIIGIVLVMAIVIILGICFSALLVPSEDDNRKRISNSSGHVSTLSQKILNWIPRSHLLGSSVLHHTISLLDEAPDWSKEFWTPIDLQATSYASDPIVTLCRLNFQQYSKSPHEFVSYYSKQ